MHILNFEFNIGAILNWNRFNLLIFYWKPAIKIICDNNIDNSLFQLLVEMIKSTRTNILPFIWLLSFFDCQLSMEDKTLFWKKHLLPIVIVLPLIYSIFLYPPHYIDSVDYKTKA